MPANDRARTALRTTLNVEDLEGRAMPSAVIAHQPQMIDPSLVRVTTGPQGFYMAGQSIANQLHNPSAMPVVSRIMVNGEMVMRVLGKPQIAAIGPAVSSDAHGNQIVRGGTKVFVNGEKIGRFQENPTITRDITIRVNQYGVAIRVLTYHVNGPLYIAPPVARVSEPWSAPVVG